MPEESAPNGAQPDVAELTADLPVGGQAVIEGVMMRVPGHVVVAVRRPDGTIAVRDQPYLSLTRRCRFLGAPVVRGAISFVEMLVLGIGALNYSAEVALQDEPTTPAPQPSRQRAGWREQLALAGTMAVALGAGIGLFFFVPLLAARTLGMKQGAVHFNVVAGLVRAALLVLYMWGIGQWREIRRVFQYHGAEHKSISTLEAGGELSVAQARRYSRLHPRCGTSFLLIVVLLAVVVFSGVDALFPVVFGHAQGLFERFATHLAMLPLIGGLSFELLKLAGRKRHHAVTRVLIAPGLWLQRITTREPDDGQLEVGLTALRCALAAAGSRSAGLCSSLGT